MHPLFDGLTYTTRGHFAKYPRILCVKPSNKYNVLNVYIHAVTHSILALRGLQKVQFRANITRVTSITYTRIDTYFLG